MSEILIGVSACLLGEQVRHDGGHRRNGFLLEELAPLVDAMPRLAIEEEGRLNDPGLREHFVDRVFGHARVRDFFSGRWTAASLIRFHSAEKAPCSRTMSRPPGRSAVSSPASAGWGRSSWPRAIASSTRPHSPGPRPQAGRPTLSCTWLDT
jgi:hypothetical protein